MRRLAIVLVMLLVAPTVHALVSPPDTNSLLLRFGGPKWPRVAHTAEYVGEFALIGIDSPAGVGERVPLPGERIRLYENGTLLRGEAVTDADGRFVIPIVFPTFGSRQLHVESDRDWRSRTATVHAADIPETPLVTATTAGHPWDEIHATWSYRGDGGAPIVYHHTRLHDAHGAVVKDITWWPGTHFVPAPGAYEVRATIANLVGPSTGVATVDVPAPQPIDPFALGTIATEVWGFGAIEDGQTITTTSSWAGFAMRAAAGVTREGAPVADDAVHIGGRWEWNGGGFERSARAVTSSNGQLDAKTPFRYISTPPAGHCLDIRSTAWVSYPGTYVEKPGNFRLCRA